jgi:hypothetical protein
MKTKFSFLLFMVLILGSCFSSAQDRSQRLDLRPLLFKNFLKADIVKKDGSTIEVSVNYNTDNQSIIFLTKDQYMELKGLEDIEQIKIDSDIFIPIGGRVYQKTERSDLFISYSNKIVVNDFITSKRGTELKNAKEGNNSSLSNVYVSKNYNSPNDLEFVKKYSVMKEGKLVEITNIKNLSKAYSINKNEVNEFVKTHNTDFNNYSDITVLLNYLVAKS